jgi:hypothetical protein
MILRCLWLLAVLPFAFADVKITSPAPGDIITGNSLTIEWEESGNSPPISDFASYAMFLCAGGNEDTNYVSRHHMSVALLMNFL